MFNTHQMAWARAGMPASEGVDEGHQALGGVGRQALKVGGQVGEGGQHVGVQVHILQPPQVAVGCAQQHRHQQAACTDAGAFTTRVSG